MQSNPLRPSLSAVVRVDTGSHGRSVLEPLTTTPATTYKTEVYDHQLDGAGALISRIIEKNRFLKKPGNQLGTVRKH